MRRLFLLAPALLLAACAAAPALAAAPAHPTMPQQEGTAGIVYTENLAFEIAAPDGWVLDNHSGAGQGLPTVLYPRDASWKDSPAVMYPNTARKTDSPHPTLSAVVERDLEQLRAASPGLKVETLAPTATRDGKTPEIRKLSGENQGNIEAVAFIDEPNAVVLLILTARTEADFTKALPAFRDLIRSYRYLTDKVLLPKKE